jgi:hypothetical protein
MSRRNVCAVLAVLVLALTAYAQSVPITLAVVEKADRNQQAVTVKQVIMEYRNQTQTIQVNVNGKTEERQITVVVPVLTERLVTIALKDARAHSGDGKALGEKELWERVKPGAVVVFGDQRLLQAPFSKVFRPEAVLLVGRDIATPQPKVEGPKGVPLKVEEPKKK